MITIPQPPPTTSKPNPSAPAAKRLDAIFQPRSVAVIGASNREGSVGHAIFKNILLGGYTGTLYPVNPKSNSIAGVHAFPSVMRIPDTVDLAIVIVPAASVPDVLQECGEKGVRGVVVVSAGFKEIGAEGAKLEHWAVEIARRHDMPLIGPNCLGVINTDPTVVLNASFARALPRRGNISVLSQSGALCAGLLDYARGRGIGFSKFISFGNKADVTELDLLRYLAADDSTDVILMYLETLADGRAFIELARDITGEFSHRKPILAIKSGRTQRGAAAARSHTGALAGSDAVVDAVFAQAGILRVDTVEELFDCAVGFSRQPLPKGNRFAVVTNAGGPGILAVDAAIRYGLDPAKLSPVTIETLRAKLPPTASLSNPVDVVGDAGTERYAAAVNAVLADPGVDGLIAVLTPQAMTDVPGIARAVGQSAPRFKKPVLASFLGHTNVSTGVQLLEQHFIPHYEFPENAARTLAAMYRYQQWLARPRTTVRHFDDVSAASVRSVIERARAEGRTFLPEVEALTVLRAYNFPILPHGLAVTEDEAVELLELIGGPVAMKIASPDIVHKTEVDGVLLNIATADEARSGFQKIMVAAKVNAPRARIAGVEIQKMARRGTEVILGIHKDLVFGHVMMFGLGGIYVEALQDVSFRLVPVRALGAANMIKSVRCAKLLEGFRGQPPADTDAIIECLERLSQLAVDFPEIQELDINPLIVHERGQGAHVADVRIVLAPPLKPTVP